MAKTNREYHHQDTEPKWQKVWKEQGIYSPKDMLSAKEPFYNLWMFPYPSAEGLHAGHAFASTGSDIYGRFMRMQGKTVFQPIGYDSFGIHSENFALKIGEHPEDMLARTTKNYERQLKNLGHGYDWNRTVTTSDPNYYKWTQWLFVRLFKAGLAYRKTAQVNWCPSCRTVLADEQVIDAKCERCHTEVQKKDLEQWFFRITDYADRLLANLDKIDWSQRVKTAQKNWVGKSQGAIINFPVLNTKYQIPVFTTRPDTLYGATFLVLAPEHPQLTSLTTSKSAQNIEKYIKAAKKKTTQDRIALTKDKTGIATGGYVKNPATGESIPVYVADYVLMEYGTGAIMGVPAHDQRDWDFATAHTLPIVEVISGGDVSKAAHDGPGKLLNSGNWNGWHVPQDLPKILVDLEKKSWGKQTTTYHLRDWLISRQRYWGPPIPMIFCQKCAAAGKSYFSHNRPELHQNQSDWNPAGWYPVPEEQLPVLLPRLEDYQPRGTGRGPLAIHPEFYQTVCPVCGANARRETDVSDTFLDSAWYFLRYPSVRAKRASRLPFDPEITKKWLPINLYFGGAEHAVLHLMYFRFTTQVLSDLKLIDFEEPAPHFFAHGLMIMGGAKMSKSRGNVVNPDEYIAKFGADTLRCYLIFMGPMDGSPDFRDTGIEGMYRFVKRLWRLITEEEAKISPDFAVKLTTKLHQTIKAVTQDIQTFSYNTALAKIMELVNLMYEAKDKKGEAAREWREARRALVLLLAPFAPHLAEEIWTDILKQPFSVHQAVWPTWDESQIKSDQVTVIIQVNGKLRGQITLPIDSAKDESQVESAAKNLPQIQTYLNHQTIKNTIFLPGKLINFVL